MLQFFWASHGSLSSNINTGSETGSEMVPNACFAAALFMMIWCTGHCMDPRTRRILVGSRAHPVTLVYKEKVGQQGRNQ